jgi:uncharacterized protein DUF3592
MSSTETETPVRASAFGCITIPFLLIASIPLFWGARSSWLDGELARNGEVVPGRVTELRHIPRNATEARSKNASDFRSPMVMFYTRAGDTRMATGSVNRAPGTWQVGGVVDVVYDPANPARANLVSEVANWRKRFAMWCAVAVLPFAIAMAPVALLLVRQHRRARLQETAPAPFNE